MKRRIYNDASESWGVEFQDAGTSTMNGRIGLYNSVMYYSFIILTGVMWMLLSAVYGEEKILIEGVEVSMAGFNILPLKPRPNGGLGKLWKRMEGGVRKVLGSNNLCLIIGLLLLGLVVVLWGFILNGETAWVAFYLGLVGVMMLASYNRGYRFGVSIINTIIILGVIQIYLLVMNYLIRNGLGDLLVNKSSIKIILCIIFISLAMVLILGIMGLPDKIMYKFEDRVGAGIRYCILVSILLSIFMLGMVKDGDIFGEAICKLLLSSSLLYLLVVGIVIGGNNLWVREYLDVFSIILIIVLLLLVDESGDRLISVLHCAGDWPENVGGGGNHSH